MRQSDARPATGLVRLRFQTSLTRRALFSRIGGGFGALGLAGVLADAGMLDAGHGRCRPRGRGTQKGRFSLILWPPSLRIFPRGPSE